ncbi:MAG TPA: ATP-binding protein [Methanospirillum sp.]|nr:ATP-binding protein [Methanospirillum sp.]
MIEINGPVYSDIITGKDLIADILPPPAYIIEPFQISLGMLEERDLNEIARSVHVLRTLESTYLTRHEYWCQKLPPGQIREKMINESHIPAMKFWNDVDTVFIPAMITGDYQAAKKIAYDSMKLHYEQHRAIIDEIVILAEEQNLQNEQMAEEKEKEIYFGMLCISLLLLVTLIAVGVITLHLLRPLKDTTTMIQEMSRGHLSMRLNIHRSDEIGQMAQAMDNLADYLQDTVAEFTRIAQGDLRGSFRAKSEHDEIAPAFNHLIDAIHDIMHEVRFLITQAEEGRLLNRGDPARFEGIYQEIIIGINNMLDAIMIPLNEALRVADEFSYARFSTRFDDSVLVKGDYIALKEGLNTIGEELSVARYKLSLLSSITRHDILNQITVVKSGLDIIEEDYAPDDPGNQVLSLVRTAVSNIREQIGFTAVYEQMGVQQPIWHLVSAIISKTQDSLNTKNVQILDTTRDLEIYADPMFGQVIYNLVDNALCHGSSLSQISFFFETSGDEGVLIMTDNGIGIAPEDKNRIFQKGFGKNTGLGLFLIREILTFTQITIYEAGTFGKGARFEMRIPSGKWRIRQVG